MSQPTLSVRLLNAKELAKMLGVTRQTIYLWLHAGRLPQPVRLGRRVIRWPEQEILEWLAAGCPSAQAWANQRNQSGGH
jgi:prophage regulatory protein